MSRRYVRQTRQVFAGLLVFMSLGTFAFSQSKVGTTSAQFLKFGAGARAIGMGEAFAAVANDATALYWNPGGIGWAMRTEVSVNHTKWLAGTQHNYAGVVVPLVGFGVVGLELITFDVGEMKVRTPKEPDGTGEWFSSGAVAMGVAYSRNLTDRFSIGGKIKYINEHIWHMSASSFAIDIGTLFITQFNDMKIGMSISNFGSKMRMEGRDALVNYDLDENIEGNNDQIKAYLNTEKWDLPLIFRVGIALDVVKNSFNRTTLAVDALHPNDSDESLNVGLESMWSNLIAIRVGWRSFGNDTMTYSTENNNTGGLTLGGGVHLGTQSFSLRLDYSYSDYGILENTQRFTLSVGI